MSAPEHRYWLTAFLASRQCRLCIIVAIAVALVPPETGLGFELCMMKRITGAPCPGCGVTRSGSNLVRGEFRRAFNFNPFGYLLHPLLFGLAGFSILPSAIRQAFAEKLLPWQRTIRFASVGFWTVFLGFGLVRWFAVMAGWMAFPPDWV